ncbi:MAG: hypothetical protein OXN89_12645 [Bryobacterales bacterium]|nr:hypothetical protein [Bryobacterales bacterium]
MTFRTSAPHAVAHGRSVAAVFAALAILPSGAFGATCEHSAGRTLAVSAESVDDLRIKAGAGSLSVRGSAGLGEVSIRGTACAPTAEALDQAQVRSAKNGTTVILTVEMPRARRLAARASLDLEVVLPRNLPVSIEDSSGDVVVSGTGGLVVRDSSGDVSVSDVTGDVSVRDGSGSIAIKEVTGSVTVTDGSGGIAIRSVGGDVAVHDGSGDMELLEIGGNLAVRDGSGGIDVRNVAGHFSLNGDGSGTVRASGLGANDGDAAPTER